VNIHCFLGITCFCFSYFTLCDKWPFSNETNFKEWFLKVEDNVGCLYNNVIGLIYFMDIDFINYSTKINSNFLFDATTKKLSWIDDVPRHIAKKRLVQFNGYRFLLLLRNDLDEPELELYSLNDLSKPSKHYTDIPNGKGLKQCIKMDHGSIFVLICAQNGLLRELLIIDIERNKRSQISLNVQLFNLGTRFVSYYILVNLDVMVLCFKLG
jgi:hypothetical protein